MGALHGTCQRRASRAMAFVGEVGCLERRQVRNGCPMIEQEWRLASLVLPLGNKERRYTSFNPAIADRRSMFSIFLLGVLASGQSATAPSRLNRIAADVSTAVEQQQRQRDAPLPRPDAKTWSVANSALREGFSVGELSPRPTNKQLATALSRLDGAAMSPEDVRPIGCHLASSAPMVFTCSYMERQTDGHWVSKEAALTIASDQWQVIALA